MSDDDQDEPFEEPEAVQVEITDELDLHHFHPREVKDLVWHYLEEAAAAGIGEVRIIHGKGIGNLRRTVHAVLDRHPLVDSYRSGGAHEGAWGATVAVLRRS